MAEKNVILVEGKDDEHVVKQLFGGYPATLPFQLKEMAGIDKLLETLPVQIDASELERLGVVVDADEQIEARWAQLKTLLSAAGYTTLPATPDQGGTLIKEQGRPLIGVWIMPDNALPGKLENFLSFLIPPSDALWPKAQRDVDAIPAADMKFQKPDEIKAKLHTWLAWQAEPGKPYGLAIRARFLDAEAPPAQQFMNWLKRLLSA